MPALLLEGPFESDYSLAIVNRRLAHALVRLGVPLRLHQRDNTTCYFPAEPFLAVEPRLAPLFVRDIQSISADVHARYIYPPYTDTFRGTLRVMHSYGWEESAFPRQFVQYFNEGLDLVTTMSVFVRDVLRQNGVRVPIEVAGLGADHILSVPQKPLSAAPRPGVFDFLHVSSCFPRKAADLLVRAFCAEFSQRDDVRLIIKSFPNPHNEIERIITEIAERYPNHAPIHLLMQSLDLAEMRYLYETAGCLVSASRGEGFGLPVAEAMFAGCPVIATIHSGQADICSPDHCWPVDFEMEPARTHLTEGASLWAKPLVGSLREQLRNVYRASARERQERTDRARAFVQDRFTWPHVAERNWRYYVVALESKESPARFLPAPAANDAPAIGFVTTWNTRCGIAEYTRYLATSLDAHRIAVFANSTQEQLVRPDEDFVMRCWEPWTGTRSGEAEIRDLVPAIVNSRVQAVSIQFNFGFFTPDGLQALIQQLRREGIITTVTMHAVQHRNFPSLRPALQLADFCICHRQADVDSVQRLGLDNVLLRKQGIVARQLARCANAGSLPRLHFVVSCFGFFLPPKGIYQLIHAFALAKTAEPLLRLKLLNSLYPAEASGIYARQCMRLIEEKRLQGDVQVCTDFLDHEHTLQELADSDLVVLPYLHSTESSSAAGAFALASLRPVLCTDLPLFDELAGFVHRVAAGNVVALANKILQLAADPAELNRNRIAQEEYVRKLAWPVVARDFADLVTERIARCASARGALNSTG
jgi:glycosyltransferase involved in cell wall biosynthesis